MTSDATCRKLREVAATKPHLVLDQPDEYHSGHEVLELREPLDRLQDGAHEEKGNLLASPALLVCSWDLRHDIQGLAKHGIVVDRLFFGRREGDKRKETEDDELRSRGYSKNRGNVSTSA